MNASAAAAREEWRGYWYLPLVAALGYSLTGLHIYALGPFMEPLQREFGWSRAQISAGASIVNFGSVFGAVFMGALVDRLGPRPIALAGLPLMGGAFALLGTATGSAANWVGLWMLVAVCFLTVHTTVWISAVVSRFKVSRGLAIAVTLSGASATAALAPLVGTWLIGRFGWRVGFAGIGGVWGLVGLPLVFLFFRGAQDIGRTARTPPASTDAPGLTLKEALRTPAFYKLLCVGVFFATCILGSAVHFVPMLIDSGAQPMTAAAAAALIGVFSLVGRLSTGALLDRFPGHVVGALATLVPLPAAALLLAPGSGELGHYLAAAAFGLTVGSEVDLLTYLVARHFGLKQFGVILGSVHGSIALGGAVGPYAAGACFDQFGSYRPFLWMIIGLMLASSLLMASLGRGPGYAGLHEAEAAAQ
jgi:MFS family permease